MKEKLAEPYRNLKGKAFTTDIISVYYGIFTKVARGIIKGFTLKKKGKLLAIGPHVKLRNKRHIYVGNNVKFEEYSEIQGLSLKGIIMGDNVTIGKYTMIRPSGYYGTDIGQGFTIGNNSSLGPYCYIGCSGHITIGENVMFGPRISLFAENHNFSDVDIPMKEQGVTQKGITIEDNCWIGSGATILDGVTIGTGSIIGSGTVVSKSVPAYSVVVGSKQNILYNRKEKAND